jgi:hypothetical protein
MNEYVADAVLVGVMKLDMWNITDCEGCRIQFGHDPRYSPYERLFFGQVVPLMQHFDVSIRACVLFRIALIPSKR